MSGETAEEGGVPPPRVIGSLAAVAAGPTLLVVAGMHGNEPAGLIAARSVLARLSALGLPRRGEIVALSGNRRALALGLRHRDKDLNRLWTPARMEALASGRLPEPHDAEDLEQAELSSAVEDVLDRSPGPVFLVDLHTTSGEGPPFAAAGDSEASREFASHLPLTVLRSLTGRLSGTLVGAMVARGVAAMVVENGQNRDPRSVAHAEAVLWVALVASGVVNEQDVAEVGPARTLLSRARGPLPRTIEVVYRHAIGPQDEFRMRPGFRHFQRVKKGQVLAEDARGEVRSTETGYVLLPLYQSLGDDGFFLGRRVRR